MMNSSSLFDLDLSVYEWHHYQENGQAVVAYLVILMVIGIVGNGHVLLVYGRARTKLNYHIFVMALAINDFTACTIILPNEITYIRYNFTYKNGVTCKLFCFLSCTLVFTSMLLLMLTGYERYRRICTPYKEQLTRKTIFIVFAAVSGISCLLSTPVFVTYGIVDTVMAEHPYLNGTKCGILDDTLTYAYFGAILLTGTIIFTFIGAGYFMIARVLIRQKRYTLKTQSNKTKFKPTSHSVRFQNNSIAIRNTISLMLVSVVSYLGSIPLFILVLLKFADEDVFARAIQGLGQAGTEILMKGYFINNVVNPIVYIIVDTQFRERVRVSIWPFGGFFVSVDIDI
ncbi:hypothetical protein FSP39_023669 [Pinctada imbricata]|uniref:G-protein coupled receptors family 1 profile domain-containing protein n=1 Tax=Pinctada imbricata TaxID=66713 RepID=A0AA89C508_PINIB|nr:hypothetical protein FSP39_023669 [Pinctada imbricata]